MTFKIGDSVRKTKGSKWQGKIVGQYSTALTPNGYAVESDTETGSVQIYPASALELFEEESDGLEVVAWISADGTHAEASTKSTVYGSHTIPLCRHSEALAGYAVLRARTDDLVCVLKTSRTTMAVISGYEWLHDVERRSLSDEVNRIDAAMLDLSK